MTIICKKNIIQLTTVTPFQGIDWKSHNDKKKGLSENHDEDSSRKTEVERRALYSVASIHTPGIKKRVW